MDNIFPREKVLKLFQMQFNHFFFQSQYSVHRHDRGITISINSKTNLTYSFFSILL